jgi:hypothetical protein
MRIRESLAARGERRNATARARVFDGRSFRLSFKGCAARAESRYQSTDPHFIMAGLSAQMLHERSEVNQKRQRGRGLATAGG